MQLDTMPENLNRAIVPIADPHDKPEELYGSGTEYFTLKFYYNGVFRDTHYNKVYYGGSVWFYDGVDVDTLCVSKFKHSAVELTKRKDVRCYYRVPTLNLMTGLRAIRSDRDIRDIIQWVPTFRLIEVYVETGVYEEQLPAYIASTDDESDDDSTSESEPGDSDKDEDDLIEIAEPHVDEGLNVDPEIVNALNNEGEDLEVLLKEVDRIEREELSKTMTHQSKEEHFINLEDNNVDDVDDEHRSSSVSTVRVVEQSDESEIEGGGIGNNTYDEEVIVDKMANYDSDYQDSYDLRSLDGSNDDEEDSKPHYPNFIPERDMQDPHFKLEMRFSSAREFKDAINEYAIINRKLIRYYTNEKWRVRAMCVGHCEWMIYASKVQGEETLQVKTFNDHHSNCRPTKRDRNLSTDWLAKRYIDTFRLNPEVPIEAFKNLVMKELEVEISTPSGYRAKRKALKLIDGEHKDQYKDLWDYCLEVKRGMPESTLILKRDGDQENEDRFKRFYMCLGPLKNGFKENCRPLIWLDAYFLKGPYQGQLLSAVAIDANNGMWPFAWAAVEQECKASWTWFLECLCNDIEQEKTWVFMSDQCKGMIDAVNKIFPHCEHRFCLRHHHANFRKKHGTKKLKDLLWDCGRASTIPRFELCMEALKKQKARAHQWLEKKVHPRHWCRAYFNTETKSDLLINNHCEIFNAFILSARDKPIITMMQRIRLLMMARIRRWKEKMMKHQGKICPRIMLKLEKNEKESYKFASHWNGGDEFEVTTAYSCYVVNLKERTCTCRKFQLNGIPCYHASSAILYMKEKLEDYMHECYHTTTYLKTYDNILSPLNGKELWQKSTKKPLSPPIVEVQPGRKKKQRNKKNDEPKSKNKLGKHRTEMHCAKCGKVGHNIRRCSGITMGVESSSSAASRKRPVMDSAMNAGPIPRRGRGRPRGSVVPRPRPPSTSSRPVKNSEGQYVPRSEANAVGTQESRL